jgi:hypothetical protein
MTPKRLKLLECLAQGMHEQEIMAELKMTRSALCQMKWRMYRQMSLPENRHQHVLAAVYSQCELFKIGLKELYGTDSTSGLT